MMKNRRTGRRLMLVLTVLLLLGLTACGQPKDGAYSQISSDQASSGSQPESSISSEVSVPESSSETSSSESGSSQSTSSGSEIAAGVVPESTPVDGSYFDDAVFVGDSVSLKLEYYESAVDKLGTAQFLTAGSLGSGNALWEISEESVHPSYNGEKMLLKDSVALTGAKKLYIMLGMNDLGVYGVEDTVANYVTLLESILSETPDLTIYVESMTPLTSTSTIIGDSLNNDNVRLYNQKMAETCQAKGWYFVDVASVMYDSDGNLNRDYCSDPDDMGVHFTEAGCEAWIQYLYTHTAG
jgi:hypothetical protein